MSAPIKDNVFSREKLDGRLVMRNSLIFILCLASFNAIATSNFAAIKDYLAKDTPSFFYEHYDLDPNKNYLVMQFKEVKGLRCTTHFTDNLEGGLDGYVESDKNDQEYVIIEISKEKNLKLSTGTICYFFQPSYCGCYKDGTEIDEIVAKMLDEYIKSFVLIPTSLKRLSNFISQVKRKGEYIQKRKGEHIQPYL